MDCNYGNYNCIGTFLDNIKTVVKQHLPFVIYKNKY